MHADRCGSFQTFLGFHGAEHLQIVMEVSKDDGVLMAPEKMAVHVMDYLKTNGYLGK